MPFGDAIAINLWLAMPFDADEYHLKVAPVSSLPVKLDGWLRCVCKYYRQKKTLRSAMTYN